MSLFPTDSNTKNVLHSVLIPNPLTYKRNLLKTFSFKLNVQQAKESQRVWSNPKAQRLIAMKTTSAGKTQDIAVATEIINHNCSIQRARPRSNISRRNEPYKPGGGSVNGCVHLLWRYQRELIYFTNIFLHCFELVFEEFPLFSSVISRIYFLVPHADNSQKVCCLTQAAWNAFSFYRKKNDQ